jgi:thioredoxin reductase
MTSQQFDAIIIGSGMGGLTAGTSICLSGRRTILTFLSLLLA